MRKAKGLKTEVMVELFMLGLTYHEIGKISGERYQAVYKRIMRAKKNKSTNGRRIPLPFLSSSKIKNESHKITTPFMQRQIFIR
jgi:hypothetical protein